MWASASLTSESEKATLRTTSALLFLSHTGLNPVRVRPWKHRRLESCTCCFRPPIIWRPVKPAKQMCAPVTGSTRRIECKSIAAIRPQSLSLTATSKASGKSILGGYVTLLGLLCYELPMKLPGPGINGRYENQRYRRNAGQHGSWIDESSEHRQATGADFRRVHASLCSSTSGPTFRS